MVSNKQTDTENGGNPPFIRETVMQKPRTPWWKRLLLTVFLALVFGLVAASVFFFTHDYLNTHLIPVATTTAENVVFPPDVPDSSEAVPTESPETPAETEGSTSAPGETKDAGENESAKETDADVKALVDEEVRRLLKEKKLNLDDYKALYGAASSLVSSVNHSLVTVIATNRSTDPFNTEFSYKTETFGVIVAITSQEVLILTPQAMTARLGENSSLSVRITSGYVTSAYTKATDAAAGLAVLAVPTENLEAYVSQEIAALPLGSSLSCYAGQPVVALGAPAGQVGSLRYGILSYVESEVAAVDNSVRLLHTDMQGTEDARGILVGLDGSVIGWLEPDYWDGMLTAVGISDIKSYIQNLSNGISTGYLGIFGQTLTASMRLQLGLSESGVYITGFAEDGPALTAGIQNGDILTAVADQPISDLRALRSLLLSMNTEQTVKVGILRKNGAGFQPLTFDVRLERR